MIPCFKPQGANHTETAKNSTRQEIELELRAKETKLDPNGNTHNTIELTNNITLLHEDKTTTCN